MKSKIVFFLILALINSTYMQATDQSWLSGWQKKIVAWGTVIAGVSIGSWYYFIKRPQMRESRLITRRLSEIRGVRDSFHARITSNKQRISIIHGILVHKIEYEDARREAGEEYNKDISLIATRLRMARNSDDEILKGLATEVERLQNANDYLVNVVVSLKDEQINRINQGLTEFEHVEITRAEYLDYLEGGIEAIKKLKDKFQNNKL